MRTYKKLIVWLYALFTISVAIGADLITSPKTVEAGGIKMSNNSSFKLVSLSPTNNPNKVFLNMKVPILISSDSKPDHAGFVRFIDHFMPNADDMIPYKSSFTLLQYEGGSLVSTECRYLLRSIETRDVLGWNWRIGRRTIIQLPRIDFVGPSLNGNTTISICLKGSM
jgi:hypothetical protein